MMIPLCVMLCRWRKEKKQEPNCCCDFCMGWWCACCSVSRMYREWEDQSKVGECCQQPWEASWKSALDAEAGGDASAAAAEPAPAEQPAEAAAEPAPEAAA